MSDREGIAGDIEGTKPRLRAFSFGGGVQSTAALVLAAERRIDFPLFIFANVGNDSENPATLDFVANVARPYAEEHGIELCEVQKRRRNGELDTIVETIKRTRVSAPIPLYLGENNTPGNRACTVAFKINVINKELRRRGASRDNKAAVGIGISTDEWSRMRTEPEGSMRTLEYPLIDLNISRDECKRIITAAGLPVPPKSSCYFCPLHSTASWRELMRTQPDLYRASVELEDFINAKRAAAGKDRASLLAHGKSLARLGEQLDLFGDEDDAEEDTPCSTAGYCMV